MSDHERHLCANCLKEEYEDFAHTCIHESIDKNDLWLAKYKINDWPRWDYSMDEATLTFSEDGKVKVICDMQVVGSAQGDSWEWSWGNLGFPLACRERMQRVKELGDEKQWEKLTTLFLKNDDDYLGWECTSIANHVLNGIGGYRCPGDGDNDFVYVVILSAQFVN